MADEQKRKRRGRRAYLNDFQSTVNGEYIYAGRVYAFDGTTKDWRRFIGTLMGLGALLAAAAVTAGSIPAPGTMDCFYVLGPYIASLFSAGSLLWGLCRMAAGGERLREYIYNKTVPQFTPRAMATAICAGCALLGELVFVLLNGAAGLVPGMVLFLLCEAVLLAGSLLWRRLVERQSWVPSGRDEDSDT